jgi:glycosyltransferase involved in cell wall biosynthesis
MIRPPAGRHQHAAPPPIADPGSPRFSVLVPSRNRSELVRHALASVLRQDFPSFEIVVSDNASDEPYADHVKELSDPRVVYSRSTTPLWVTANWNRALAAARGEYVVMLGDDDALAPGYFAQMHAMIERFEQPDIVYSMAYHYAYPGVSVDRPDGYFATVNNSPVFRRGQAAYRLDPTEARRLARKGIELRHEISFNAQHFLYKRSFIKDLESFGPFYQSPYPDFYACFMSFWKARSIVVDPKPRTIIGISPRSFGFFFMNRREAEGNEGFLSQADGEGPFETDNEKIAATLRLPGSDHLRNWLIAALQTCRRLSPEADIKPNLNRYRRLQIFEFIQAAAVARTCSHADFRQFASMLNPIERRFAEYLFALVVAMGRIKAVKPALVSHAFRKMSHLHAPAEVLFHDIGRHGNIEHALQWLETNQPWED